MAGNITVKEESNIRLKELNLSTINIHFYILYNLLLKIESCLYISQKFLKYCFPKSLKTLSLVYYKNLTNRP